MRVEFLPNGEDRTIETIVSDTPDVLKVVPDGLTCMWATHPAPPFVSASTYARYIGQRGRLSELDLCVQWRIHTYPNCGPRMWKQQIEHGQETRDSCCVADVDLHIDVPFDVFCRFLVGGIPLRQMPGAAHVDGSLGALSALHWFVAQPGGLRTPEIWGAAHAVACAGVGR